MVVNIKPKTCFHGQMEVKQRGPLSSLVVDVPSCLISKAVVSSLIKGVKVGSKELIISHLYLADNNILFLENDKDSFLNVLFLFKFLCYPLG